MGKGMREGRRGERRSGNIGWERRSSLTFFSDTGEVYSFGANNFGQLGQLLVDTKDSLRHPALVKVLENEVITHISCGGQHSVAVDENNDVWVWGSNKVSRGR
jgi:alpha-tubulin suppressor-like RCC1 family protein